MTFHDDGDVPTTPAIVSPEIQQAHFLTLHTPAGFDGFTLAAGTPATDTMPPEPAPPDPAVLAALAGSYGIEMVGPPLTP